MSYEITSSIIPYLQIILFNFVACFQITAPLQAPRMAKADPPLESPRMDKADLGQSNLQPVGNFITKWAIRQLGYKAGKRPKQS